ncbi:MAG: hypothetical protein L0Z52_03150 [Acidobacteria bacterium]|nr:hypothetical protein [Acidobacteriota bacterium]
MDARFGVISLAIFGLAVLWCAGCALWIQSLMPSEAALPVFGFLYIGVLGLSATGGICALLGVALKRGRGWGAVVGLLLNVSPWLYLLWLFAKGNL